MVCTLWWQGDHPHSLIIIQSKYIQSHRLIIRLSCGKKLHAESIENKHIINIMRSFNFGGKKLLYSWLDLNIFEQLKWTDNLVNDLFIKLPFVLSDYQTPVTLFRKNYEFKHSYHIIWIKISRNMFIHIFQTYRWIFV